MKKIIAALLAVVVLVSVFSSVVAAAEKGRGWYVKRVPDHKQPRADADMEYVTELGGYYVDKKHGDDDSDKVIYLTFDAGYENGHVAEILNVLKKEQVSGAFFILSHLITSSPDLVRRMAEEGHLVCNHSVHHKDMSCMSAEEFAAEIRGLEQEYTNLTGKKMAPYFRPPEGKFSKNALLQARKLGYKTVFWSLAYADWDNRHQPDLEKAKEKLLSNTHNGAVVLLHPTSATNAAILSDLIKAWKAEGYRFGTLDELTSGRERGQ